MSDFDYNESSRARGDVARGFITDDTPLKVYTPNDTITPGGYAETSFSTQNVDAYGRPIDTLYDKSIRDGSAFDTQADVHISSGTSILPSSLLPPNLEATSGTFGMKSPPPKPPPRKQPW